MSGYDHKIETSLEGIENLSKEKIRKWKWKRIDKEEAVRSEKAVERKGAWAKKR